MKCRKFGQRKGFMLLILVCASFSGYAGITFHRMNNDRSSSAINKPAFGQKKDREDAENSAIKYEHSLPYNCTHETARLNAEKAAQDDPRLIYLIKRCYLEHPSTLPYELENPDRQDYSQGGQSVYVDELLNHTMNPQDCLLRCHYCRFCEGFEAVIKHCIECHRKENGFFVESGAFDGEYLSNSLFFERQRHWTGLLVEPVSDVFSKLRLKNRKSFCVKACLSDFPYPVQKRLEVNNKYPELSKTKKGNVIQEELAIGTREELIQCFPFYSILLATGHTRVDLFSLDVEGVEMEVLNTIPWEKVGVKVLIVEFNHLREGKAGLVSYLASKGYRNLPSLQSKGGSQDAIFMKNS